jgi:hypothetical protein
MGILNFGGGNGLLGLGGIGGVASTGALGSMGGLLDPQEMKKQQIKNAMLQAGISLMTNGGIGEAVGAGLLGAQQARDQFVDSAKTAYDFQRTQKQDSRQDAEWEMKLKEQERQDKIRRAQEAWMAAPDDQSLLAQAYPDEVAKAKVKASLDGGGGDEYGLNPVWLQNEKGEWMLVQPSKSGSAPRPMQFPEGYTPAPPTRTLDTGTGFETVPTRGAPVPMGAPIPKDIRGREIQEAVGQSEGKAIASAPADMQAAEEALNIVDQIKVNPYLERGTGLSSYGNSVPGTGGYDFQNLVDQAKSGAFLTAIQQMRGLGQLSNAEGQTATAAIARMDTATSKEAFMKALDDYERVIRKAYDKAAGRIGAAPMGKGFPDLSKMSDDELKAILDGQ